VIVIQVFVQVLLSAPIVIAHLIRSERGILGIGALAKSLDDNASLCSRAVCLLPNGDWST